MCIIFIGKLYNIEGDYEIPNIEVAKDLIRLLGKDEKDCITHACTK